MIGNEVICSGFQAKDNALLMIYGIFENNGDLELRIKAKNKQDKNDLLNYIKQYIWLLIYILINCSKFTKRSVIIWYIYI